MMAKLYKYERPYILELIKLFLKINWSGKLWINVFLRTLDKNLNSQKMKRICLGIKFLLLLLSSFRILPLSKILLFGMFLLLLLLLFTLMLVTVLLLAEKCWEISGTYVLCYRLDNKIKPLTGTEKCCIGIN